MMTVKPWQLGSVVMMTKGRERGRYGVIVAQEGGSYVRVADGRKRTVARPKRKNIRHLSMVRTESAVLTAAICEQRPFRDEEIRAAITEAQPAKAKGGSDEQGRCH